VNIKQTTFEHLGHGRRETATLSEVAGVVILEMWGGENTYTFQTMSMQSGRTDVSFVSAVVDSPIHQEVISFEDRSWAEDRWRAKLREVIDQLARKIAYAHETRVIAEESERLIAEHVYKALLRSSGYCCPECGAEDPRSGAPDCSACRQVRTELAKEAELGAGWDPSP
jgi:hypothetical protein